MSRFPGTRNSSRARTASSSVGRWLTCCLPGSGPAPTSAAQTSRSIRGYAGAPDVRERLRRNPLMVQRGYVDRDLWRASVDAARVGRLPSLHDFLSAACLELWLQTEGPS